MTKHFLILLSLLFIAQDEGFSQCDPLIAVLNTDVRFTCDDSLEVRFDVEVDRPVSYFWHFGIDSSLIKSPVIQFNEKGIYPVELLLTDTLGCDTLMLDTIRVVGLEAVAKVIQILTPTCIGQTLLLEDCTSSSSEIKEWYWRIGQFESNARDTSVFIETFDYYNLFFSVVDEHGCTDSYVQDTLDIPNLSPFGNFHFEVLDTCGDLSVQFTNDSYPDGNFWFWDFGDGNLLAGDDPEGEENPIHTFRDTGCYEVELIIFNDGCSSSTRKTVCIYSPIADFNVERDCADRSNIQLINQSIDMDSYSWDFGVTNMLGDTSNLENPAFTYNEEGVYNISLIAHNHEMSCTDTMIIELPVLTEPLSFETSIPGGCAPVTVEIYNTSPGIRDFEWSSPGGRIDDRDEDTTTIFYVRERMYQISLIAEDLTGCIDTLTIPFNSGEISQVGIDSLQCNNNNTPHDPSDDIIEFVLNPSGEGLDTSYCIEINGAQSQIIGYYNEQTKVSLEPGSAGNGDVVLILFDKDNQDCKSEITIEDPGSCSVTSTQDPNSQGIRLSPIPTNDILTIEGLRSNVTAVHLYDLAGKLVLADQTGQSELNMASLPSGLYLLKVFFGPDKGSSIHKIVKQ